MEQPSNRLYSGTLSQAAQKVLAVLRAQSLRADRHPLSSPYNHRQLVERYSDNQRELLAHSSWRMSQEKSSGREGEWPQVSTFSSHYDSSNWWQSVQTSDCFLSSKATSHSSSSQIALYYQRSPMNSQRPQSDPSTYQSSQAHPFTLREVDETATPLSHRETNTLCSQMPERPLEFQTTPWRNSHQGIRTSFIHNSELPDEVFSMAEHPKAPEDSQALSCPLKSEETDNTSGEWKGKGLSDICNLNECEDKQGADSVEKWKLTGPDAAELTISAEDRGMRLQQTESETKNLSPSSSRQNPLVLDSGSTANEQHAKWKEGGCRKASLCKFFECDRQREKLVEKEGNDFACRLTTPKIEEVEQPPTGINVKILMGSLNGSPIRAVFSQNEDHEESQCQPANTQYMKDVADKLELTREQTVNTDEETESSTMECTDEVCPARHLCSNIHLTEEQCETDCKEIQEQSVRDTDVTEGRRDRAECTHTEDRTRESGSTPTLSLKCRAKRSAFRAPCILQRNDNIEISKGNIRRSSSSMTTSTFADGHTSSSVHDLVFASIEGSKKVKKINLRPSLVRSHPPLIPLLPLKRKHKMRETKNAHSLPKIIRRPPKWKILHCSQKMTGQGEVKPELKGATPKTLDTECLTVTTLQTDVSVHVEGDCNDQHDPKQSQKNQQLILSHVTWQPLKRNNSEPYREVNGPKIPNEEANGNEPYNQTKPSYFLSTLTSDPRVKDCEKLNMDEKMEIFEEVRKAKALILTLVYRDGTTQLDPEQKLTPPACGLLMLIKNSADSSIADDSLGPNEILVYLKLDHTPTWKQQHTHQNQEVFTREMLLHVLSNSQPVVCYKAKDLLCTALQFYRREISWKQVAGCHIQDPQVSGWLLDPANPCSRYQDLLYKHSKRVCATSSLGVKKVSQIISDLCLLYWLNMELVSKLQNQGLWELYTDMELNMISVLAVMESHRIHVDKEALKRTSELLGTKMKQLEQEAHQAAGQIFLVTSNSQLRKVLFEKLCLHEQCENKRLPKTLNKQQQSTSEAALLQLQDLHPLPKIILEHRQVHKIKSTFVDGILSCMMNRNYISTKWYQTSVVTGRISAKHPNFQAVPRQPLKITKTHRVPGTEGEMVSIHPRAMFIPQEGWTFLAADFCQVELRLLAHLSADPELLHIFTDLQTDVFTMLASQWKGVSQGEVTSEDREHTKRVVYSVVYGAGRERLSGILGVSAEQAGQFLDSFLQTYKEVPAFIQRIIQQCHQQGYVLSIMGRRRTLPNINSPDWGIRMQAERQAVNFVVQGSAADLCKMAMIRIFNLVSSSSLSARLIAQLHDELLYEVEDAQVEEFAALVKRTMESLQHIDHLGVHLKVPLKVAVSCGKSWGFMSELNIPPTSPSPL